MPPEPLQLRSLRVETFLGLLFAAAVVLGWLAYRPGLQGSFLFDDFANLPALGDYGRIDNWSALLRYVTSGTADPTGRPLALLSFLIDANDWPAEPYAFKRTNVLLHLFNGVLVFWLLLKLGCAAGYRRRHATAAAVVAAAMWMLHPLWISTTLYIVQREAMLPATTVLAGLLLWLHGRERICAGASRSGALWMTLGLAGGTVLGLACKANGALLPAYALLCEYLLLRPRHPLPDRSATVYKYLLYTLAWLPSLLIAAYLGLEAWRGLTGDGSGSRPFTIGQRLLTEPRVVLDYLRLLWLPHPYTTGVFNDQIDASSGLFTPLATLPAMCAIAALLAAAWRVRHAHPLFAFAVLFYFLGQSLESTVIPLELYFEHRNYIPAIPMFWPLAIVLTGASGFVGARRVLSVALPLALASMTWAGSNLWGDTRQQSELWAALNPGSARAQANAAQIEFAHGQVDAATARLEAALRMHPDDLQLTFNLIGARCAGAGVKAEDIAAAQRAIQHTRNPGGLLHHWIDQAISLARSSGCPGLDLPALDSLLAAGAINPYFRDNPGRRQDLLNLRGRITLVSGDAAQALETFNAALDAQVRSEAALQQAALLGAAGYPREALAHLDHYDAERAKEMPPAFGMPQIHAWLLTRQGYWEHELAHLRQVLQTDLRDASTPDSK